MNGLPARDAYRLWAPIYGDENAVSWLEDRLVAEMTPPLSGSRLLDAGCGTGRRLRGTGAARAVGIDLSPEMLEAGGGDGALLVGDLRALPLADRAFDLIWCRLAIGHVADCRPVYSELARVAAKNARLIVTDFHPQAYAAGHRRSFRDRDGVVREVEHHVHERADHLTAASAAGCHLIDMREATVGAEVRRFYDEAGRGALYAQHAGLPVVLALAFSRAG
ncbi:MAG TPA: class I SAM-dependent methyltransferase [Allosphingosinicella sp.]|nr:class I SAM-dependent methyltransferase [Allosphingosinicella sp.]